MKPLTISDPDIILGLQDEIRRSEESRYDHRLHGLLLVAHGLSCREVAQLLGDSPRTVQYWVNRFEKDGLAAMVEGERPGRPCALGDKELAEINRVLRQTPKAAGLGENLWDGKSLSAFIKKQFRVELGVRQCQRLVSTIGLSIAQAASLDRPCRFRITKTVQKKLKRLVKDPDIDLWAEDEVHFQQHGSRCRMWIAPEITDPVVLHQPTRKSVGYFGAVRLRTASLLTAEKITSSMPKPFSLFSSNSSRALVVPDDVSWFYWITLATIMENFTRIGGATLQTVPTRLLAALQS